MRKKNNPIKYLSHDLKTPIVSMKGLMELSLESINNQDLLKNNLNLMKNNLLYLELLVHEILDYNRYQEDRLIKQSTYFSMNNLIDECNQIINHKILEKDICYIVHRQMIKNDSLYGDYLHTKQILLNLLSNAVKFTNHRGVVRFKVKELNEGRFQFEISDNGCGIAKNNLKKIFKPYYQENKNQGTGLGLSLTKSLVSLLDGTINVVSKVDEGSVFTVELPYKIVNQINEEDIKGIKVLLVDDNEIVQTITGLALKESNAIVGNCFNGKDAIMEFSANDYDIILLDIVMPDLDGFEVNRVIKSTLKYQEKKIPIIAMTAKEEVDELREFDDYLLKPIKKQELLNKLVKFKNNKCN